jgi:prolyl-tRNA editing enzyme YbaK/EbsC (Cys-tRNA(Pro) deacylase)
MLTAAQPEIRATSQRATGPRNRGVGIAPSRGILAAVPTPSDHPAIQRVRDAAARKGVTLDVHVFEDTTHTAAEAAAAIGCELAQIVKSLVFVAPAREGDGLSPVLCLVSGVNRVDLARLAAVTGDPAIRRATAREANDATGFVIGGIPPIGHAHPVRVLMDPDLGRFEIVWAAAGTPTAVFPVEPATLRVLANAEVAPFAAAPTPEAAA